MATLKLRRNSQRFLILGVLTLLLFVVILPKRPVYAYIADGANAIDILGQYTTVGGFTPNYTQATANNANGSVYALGLAGGGYTSAIDTVNHRLFVLDSSNNRALIYNLDAGDNLVDKTPDFVIGQPNFTSNAAATTQAGLNVPQGLAYDEINQRLFVTQSTGNRVTVYDVTTITNGENAVNVLGQPNFTSNAAATTQTGMNSPLTPVYDYINNRLFVSQSGTGHRVTVYDVTTITDGENAINVLGQPNFTSGAAANNQAGMNVPTGMAYDFATQRLFVAGSGNNRVTVYDVAAITNGENAINVLGQANFTATAAATTQAGMSAPRGIAFDPVYGRLFVTGFSNNRVTVFDVNSITDGENAVNVLGQANFVSGGAATTQSGMSGPRSLVYDAVNHLLYVGDFNNNRMMIYDVEPTPGFTIVETGGTTVVSESGSTDTFTVALISRPASTVVLDLASADTGEGTISTSSLTFTPANWDIPQVVTLTGVDEFLVDGTQNYNISVSVNVGSSAAAYGVVASQNVAASTTDNDVAGATVLVTDNLTGEDLSTGTFTIVLTAQPTADVTIPLVSNDITEGTSGVASVTFTNLNWNIPQTVTITGVDDFIVDGAILYQIVTGDVTSLDLAFDALDGTTIADPDFTNQDNDSPGFNLVPSGFVTTEAGGTVTIQFTLLSQPAGGADVTIPLSLTDVSEGSIPFGFITILNANWNNGAANTITITGVDDPQADGDIVYSLVTGDPTSLDPIYDALLDTDIADVTLTNLDNEVPGFTIVPTGGTTIVSETGTTDTFTIVLNAEPLSNVVFDISSADVGEGTVLPINITFNPVNWNTPQVITLTGVDDVIVDGTQNYNITVSVNAGLSDPVYAVLANQNVAASTTDDDVAVPLDTDGDGVTDAFEDGARNGDGNDDGIQDKFQGKIASVVNAGNGQYITLQITGDCQIVNGLTSVTEASLAVQDAAYFYPVGLMNFELACLNPGDSVVVTVFLDQVYDTSTWQMRKLVGNTTYQNVLGGFTYGADVVQGTPVSTIVYNLTDGGINDDDGIINSFILDPVGPGAPLLASTGGKYVGVIMVAATGVIASISVYSVYKKRKAIK